MKKSRHEDTEGERPKKAHKKSHSGSESETRMRNNTGTKLYVIDGSTEKTNEVESTTNWRGDAISVSRKYTFVKPSFNGELTLFETDPWLVGAPRPDNGSDRVETIANKEEQYILLDANRCVYRANNELLLELQNDNTNMAIIEKAMTRERDTLKKRLDKVKDEIDIALHGHNGTYYYRKSTAILEQLQLQEQLLANRLQKCENTLESLLEEQRERFVDGVTIEAWMQQSSKKVQQLEKALKDPTSKIDLNEYLK